MLKSKAEGENKWAARAARRSGRGCSFALLLLILSPATVRAADYGREIYQDAGRKITATSLYSTSGRYSSSMNDRTGARANSWQGNIYGVRSGVKSGVLNFVYVGIRSGVRSGTRQPAGALRATQPVFAARKVR